MFQVYFVGQKGGGIEGRAGCIGCICRPDRTVSKFFEWTIQGEDPDFKHAIVEKTKQNKRQGKVRSEKNFNSRTSTF